MEIFVGTSGWSYSWNEGKSLEWYVKNSSLNAVELNASFYRFPFPNHVKSWSIKGSNLRWSIKVNRLITHMHKFSERAFDLWIRFNELFEPLKKNIDFYLFQLPPNLKATLAPKIESFAKKTRLKDKFALEVRNESWFNDEMLNWASSLGITWVSVDSPKFPLDVFNSNKIVYERMHGRTLWYSHFYSDDELKEIAEKIVDSKPNKAYIFFNNDHAMLKNSKTMLSIFNDVLD
jgi:uncharacterized protein YecE (DUF72 family)